MGALPIRIALGDRVGDGGEQTAQIKRSSGYILLTLLSKMPNPVSKMPNSVSNLLSQSEQFAHSG